LNKRQEQRVEPLGEAGEEAGADESQPMDEEWEKQQGKVFWHLKKIPLLQNLSARDWERLQPVAELRELKKRTVVYLPGDPASDVYFVNGGRVKVSRVTRDGREITLAYIGPGEIVGENCLFHGGVRGEMLETADSCLITEVPRDVIQNLLKRRPKMMADLFTIVARRRREVEERLQHLVFRDVNAKLAELMLDLGEQYGHEGDDGIRVGLKITHQEMANLIGSTRETVSLNISRFRRKGLINLERRQIILTDLDGLKALL
jgi:CRP-like cAMP-binding protein